MLTTSQFVASYVLDLVTGDPSWMPHPVRWIGSLIERVERVFYRPTDSPMLQRVSGAGFWIVVLGAVLAATFAVLILTSFWAVSGWLTAVWISSTTLATHSLHRESAKVAAALRAGDIESARKQLSMLVSRDTSHLDESGVTRALIETVSENISDGITAPLFYLALGGPAAAVAYKAVNTMDSMVGYMNDRYRYFGWFAARADDVANWVPARLSGIAVVGAAGLLGLDWRGSLGVMSRDSRKMKSPNAGYPEAAAAGALGVQLGGPSIYFGHVVDKPTLGSSENPLSIETYDRMVKLMYGASLLSFGLAVCLGRLIHPH